MHIFSGFCKTFNVLFDPLTSSPTSPAALSEVRSLIWAVDEGWYRVGVRPPKLFPYAYTW